MNERKYLQFRVLCFLLGVVFLAGVWATEASAQGTCGYNNLKTPWVNISSDNDKVTVSTGLPGKPNRYCWKMELRRGGRDSQNPFELLEEECEQTYKSPGYGLGPYRRFLLYSKMNIGEGQDGTIRIRAQSYRTECGFYSAWSSWYKAYFKNY